jgi:hypothetical protein
MATLPKKLIITVRTDSDFAYYCIAAQYLKVESFHFASSPLFGRGNQSFFSVMSRVTRFGEFSTNGRLLTMDSFLKITEVADIFVPQFSMAYIIYYF